MTQTSSSNSGYTIFKVDPETLIPNSLKMVFLPINQTIGLNPSKSQPMFRVFDYQYFGVTDLTINSMIKLKEMLKSDNNAFLKYLVMKRGFDPEDP